MSEKKLERIEKEIAQIKEELYVLQSVVSRLAQRVEQLSEEIPTPEQLGELVQAYRVAQITRLLRR